MEIYRQNLGISSMQWLELLKDESVFKKHDLELLRMLYFCNECREKASVLANKLGLKNYSILNLQIGRLGKRIVKKFYNVNFPTRKNGTIRYWHIPFLGEDGEVNGQFYWQLRPELKEAFEIFNDFLCNIDEDFLIIEQIPNDKIKYFPEGAKKQIVVNAYERNRKARHLCIQKYGYRCYACGFDFKDFYGDIGSGYIEVHHIKPLSEINEEYIVDPINDLIPLCPNCHSMVHKANITVDKLRDLIIKRK